MTVTFTAPKVANVLPPASHLNGKLVIAEIGSPRTLVSAAQSQLFITEEQDARDFLISTRYRRTPSKILTAMCWSLQARVGIPARRYFAQTRQCAPARVWSLSPHLSLPKMSWRCSGDAGSNDYGAG